MDPCVKVATTACEFVSSLAPHFGKDLLFYFNSILSRGLLYGLSHKQAKLRLAALNAIDKLMYCSPFKKNVEIFLKEFLDLYKEYNHRYIRYNRIMQRCFLFFRFFLGFERLIL